jgi:DNA-binding CsgD family transcriptional regulator
MAMEDFGLVSRRGVTTAVDVMNILDAIYDVEHPSDRWLNGVLCATSTTLDLGAGVVGVLYKFSDGIHLRIDLLEGINLPHGWREVGLAMHRDPSLVPAIIASYRSFLCATLPEIAAIAQKVGADINGSFERHAVGGQVTINGVDCSGNGCALYLLSNDPVSLSSTQRELFSRLATHISTAYRLQRRLAGGARDASIGIEAMLTPTGRVDHAEAEAKSIKARRDLTLAVRLREHARASAKTDTTGRIVRTLNGLVEARWTVVDQYKSDGKRYVLACENALRPSGPPRLSQREQEVVALAALGLTNKVIAYELGLAFSTVRVLMARASMKLGTATRSELITQHNRSASTSV